jgi:hypothetical protein
VNTSIADEFSDKLPIGLRKISFDKKDTEGKAPNLDAYYELTNGSISESINYLKESFSEIKLVPIGGFSAGGSVFSNESSEKKTIGLLIAPPHALSERNNISYTISEGSATAPLKTQELHINTKEKTVQVGAGVVLDQINASVQEALGADCIVLGADLTSSGYASAGGTFMTGGMGPSRISFADTVQEITLFDGVKSQTINGEENLALVKETYGWTGIIEHLILPIVQVPKRAFGFALPINSSAEELGKLAAYFSEKTKPVIDNGIITNDVLVLGLEFISENALRLIEKNMPNLNGFDQLKKNIVAANKKSAVFISGYAQENPFEDLKDALGIFVENKISGLAFEQAMPFDNLQDMKMLREAAPDISRAQFRDAQFVYKNHTDINIQLDINKPAESMETVFSCYERYQKRIELLLEQADGITGNMQVYGHLNPQGVDPHYRLTLVAKTQKQLSAAQGKASELYNILVQEIQVVCSEMNCKLTGGEKGFISNQKVVTALLKNESSLPEELANKFSKQKETILQANSIFNWRAKL